MGRFEVMTDFLHSLLVLTFPRGGTKTDSRVLVKLKDIYVMLCQYLKAMWYPLLAY